MGSRLLALCALATGWALVSGCGFAGRAELRPVDDAATKGSRAEGPPRAAPGGQSAVLARRGLLQALERTLDARLVLLELELERRAKRGAPLDEALQQRRLALTIALGWTWQELRAETARRSGAPVTGPTRRPTAADVALVWNADVLEREALAYLAERDRARDGWTPTDTAERERSELGGEGRYKRAGKDKAKGGDESDEETGGLLQGNLRIDDVTRLAELLPVQTATTPAAAEPAPEEKAKAEKSSSGHGRRPGTVGEATVRTNAPPAGVLAAVEKQLDRLAACVPSEARAQGELTLRVRARVDADGRLRSPAVEPSLPLAPSAVACLVDVLGQVRAEPSPDGSSRTVSFPLLLGTER